MADSKITALTSIGASTDPANDPLVLVDVSDTSMAASGTTKKVTLNQLLGASGTATLASATITGDLTVDTSTLKVDSANNRVGIGTASPAAGYSLDIAGGTVGGIRVSSNNYPNLVVDSANSNGSLIYIQEGGTTQARIGHLTLLTGLEFSGNNGTAAANVHYAISSTGVSTWSNVGGVAGTAMTLNSTGLGLGASPSERITVNSSTAANYIKLTNSGATTGFLIGCFNTAVDIRNKEAGAMNFFTSDTQRMQIDSSGNVISNVTGTAPTLGVNSQMVFNLTSNTNLRISVRGTDGVTRVANITLA